MPAAPAILRRDCETARMARSVPSRARAVLLTVAATVTVLGVAGVSAVVNSAARSVGECSVIHSLNEFPALRQGWDAEQRANAAVIMDAGRDLGLPARDQAIAVMTAMGESSLRNLEYGDWETSGTTNPDGSRTTSIGLFQQQDEWGAREERMNPHSAATLFYRAMVNAVPDAERQALAPTIVAHRTQINSDPEHYAKYWPAAVDVVDGLSGAGTGLSEPSTCGSDAAS